MFNNLLTLCAAAGGAAAILTILIRIYIDYIRTPSPSEVLKQELTIDNDDVNLIIKTEGNINPSEVLDMIEGVDKGILTVNEARTNEGLKPVQYEPFVNFQKAAHDFGETKTPPKADNKRITIRTARICQNCGSNVFEPSNSLYPMTCAYCGTTYN